jgi:hypothetical protein
LTLPSYQNRIADDGKAHDTTIVSWLPATAVDPELGKACAIRHRLVDLFWYSPLKVVTKPPSS